MPHEEIEQRVDLSDWFPEWHKAAICFTLPPSTFFGDAEAQRSMSPLQIKQAAEICETCPVFAQCLTYALEHKEQYGVWAGTSGRVRMRMQRMITIGMVTVADIVKDYLNGNKAPYEGINRQEVTSQERRAG